MLTLLSLVLNAVDWRDKNVNQHTVLDTLCQELLIDPLCIDLVKPSLSDVLKAATFVLTLCHHSVPSCWNVPKNQTKMLRINYRCKFYNIVNLLQRPWCIARRWESVPRGISSATWLRVSYYMFLDLWTMWITSCCLIVACSVVQDSGCNGAQHMTQKFMHVHICISIIIK